MNALKNSSGSQEERRWTFNHAPHSWNMPPIVHSHRLISERNARFTPVMHHLAATYLFFHPTHLSLGCCFCVFLRAAGFTPPTSSNLSPPRLVEALTGEILLSWGGGCGRRVSKVGSEYHARVPVQLPGERKLEFAVIFLSGGLFWSHGFHCCQYSRRTTV